MFYCVTCSSAYAFPEVAHSLGRLMCCGNAILPVGMLEHGDGVRSPFVRCTQCQAMTWQLPREAQLDHSLWKGGIHCGCVPVIAEFQRRPVGDVTYSGHVGRDLPSSMELERAPLVPLGLFGPRCR